MTGRITPDGFAAAAQALVETRFRLGGRTPAGGLDCIGLVACALGGADAPSGYRLRNSDIARHFGFAARAGFVPAHGPIMRGDIVLVQPGPAQHHLLVALAPLCFVHAHAGLGRVVIHTGPLPWPQLAHWRLATESI